MNHDYKIIYQQILDFISNGGEDFSTEQIYKLVNGEKDSIEKRRLIQSNISGLLKKLKTSDLIYPIGKHNLYTLYKRARDLDNGGFKKINHQDFIKI